MVEVAASVQGSLFLFGQGARGRPRGSLGAGSLPFPPAADPRLGTQGPSGGGLSNRPSDSASAPRTGRRGSAVLARGLR